MGLLLSSIVSESEGADAFDSTDRYVRGERSDMRRI